MAYLHHPSDKQPKSTTGSFDKLRMTEVAGDPGLAQFARVGEEDVDESRSGSLSEIFPTSVMSSYAVSGFSAHPPRPWGTDGTLSPFGNDS